MPTVGVLGGSGFIGQRLVQHLTARGAEVRIGDIVPWQGYGATYVECDIRDREAVNRFVDGLDVVYNLAAEHRDDVRPVEKYQQVNVDGARILCDVMAARKVRRLVFTSSVAVYGVPEGPATEETPFRPFNEYGRTKLEAEGVYEAWALAQREASLAIIRPTVVFGERNRGNVYNLTRQVASGRFVMVGNGRNRKSMAYVENVAGFLAFALEMGSGTRIFNYADGPDFEMNDLVSLIRTTLGKGSGVGFRLPYGVGMALGHTLDAVARVSGRSLPVSAVRVKKFCASTEIVAAKAFSTGFRPAYSLEEGFRRFLQHEFGAEAALGPAAGLGGAT